MASVSRYFTGEFEHSIDSVNRLVIPAKWRSGESEELFVFPGEEGRLAVLPREEVDRMAEEIRMTPGLSARERRDETQNLFSNAVQLTCDGHGRITMDSKSMKHSGLKNTVILVGGGQRFEMWNPKAWQQRKADLSGKINATMERFGI